MRRLKSTARFVIFSTALISSAAFLLYLMLISDINAELAKLGVDFSYNFTKAKFIVFFAVIIFSAYMISAVLIDKIMNPLRLMIAKIKDIGEMKFSKPLVINSEDEELKEYTAAFNEMSQKLNGYIERQKRFISDVSHELTTPITVINGHTDMLLRWGKNQPDLLETELRIIQAEALRMSELTDSLLLLSRSDNGKQRYSFESIILSEPINESVSEMKLVAPDFDFETAIEQEIRIKCDDYAIRRVLRIIFSNAVKYSGDKKLISIKANETGGLVNICVRDYGIGIAQPHIARVFDRFYRVDDSRSKKTGGSGLGLSIAKEIINAHGGSISITSELGTGTEVCIVIPTSSSSFFIKSSS